MEKRRFKNHTVGNKIDNRQINKLKWWYLKSRLIR